MERTGTGCHWRRRTAASRLRLGRNAYLDPESGRHRRPRHRLDPLDPDRPQPPHGRRRAAPADRIGQGRWGRALHGGRHRGIGEHRSRRSLTRHRRRVQGVRRLVPRRWRVWRFCRRRARRAIRSACHDDGRLGRGGSAQVAVCAARGRVRAGARPRAVTRGVRLSPAVLPLRRGGDQLRGLRSAELPRFSRPQGVAGVAACGRFGLPRHDCRGHAALSRHGRRGPALRRNGTGDAGAEHHHVPLCAARPSTEARRPGR